MQDYLLFGSTGTSSVHFPETLSRTNIAPPSAATDWTYDETFNNAVKIHGPVVDRCLTFLQAPDGKERGTIEPTEHLFDEIEAVVFKMVVNKHGEAFLASRYHLRYVQFTLLSRKSVSEDDFSLFRVLGRGGYGVVSGCKRCQSGKLYALKVLDRKRVKTKKSESLALNERNILASVDSKFVVCLKYAFATPQMLYLVLDLMMGGDLRFHLKRRGKFTKKETKYYICRTILGLEALHALNVVYRDLKPDNLLMDDIGRTRISDLGLAVRVPKNGLTGACGTRGYWAPEMLRRDANGQRLRYSLSVDWFSLGCVLFEFTYGVSPFRTDTAKRWGGGDLPVEAAIDLAIQEMDPYFDPNCFDPLTKDLCVQLLGKDGKTRLGANGAEEIMAHPYFADINWEEVRYERIPPPSVPRKDLNLASQKEIGSFDEEAVSSVKNEPPSEDIFKNWDYVRASSFFEEVVLYLQFQDINVRLYIWDSS